MCPLVGAGLPPRDLAGQEQALIYRIQGLAPPVGPNSDAGSTAPVLPVLSIREGQTRATHRP
jgi:hypothetical protein